MTEPPLPPSSPVWFDPQCRANDAELTAATKAFGRYLESREKELGVRSRSRTLPARKSFNLAVEAICCNLLIAMMVSDETPLAVPLAHKIMWGRGRYANPVYGQHFLDCIDLLMRLGLIKRLRRGYRFSAQSKAPSLVIATKRLAEYLPVTAIRWHSIRREPDKELIILKADKDEDGRSPPIEYKDSKNVKAWRGQVARINNWLASADIELLSESGSRSIGEDGGLIAFHRRSLHRTFNNGSWQDGGRIFGGFWMSMKREDRFRRIRIDGEPVADVDYQQLYPRLAYVRAQAEMPEGDIYDVAGDGSSRDGWKTLLNAMLFAEKPLGGWPKNTRECFPDGMTLREAVSLIERKHQPIVHLFGSGLGFQLMRIESDMLIAVMTHLFKNGITALPLHDAVLVAQSRREAASKAMQEEITHRTGSRRAAVKIDVRPI